MSSEVSGESGRVAPGREDDSARGVGEAALWSAFKDQGSAEARERLFAIHLPFARRVAGRDFRDRGGADIEFSDLFQFACEGLLEALDRYDPARAVPFESYAVRRISGSVLDGISKATEVREQISFRSRVKRERARSLAAAGTDRLPTADAMQALIDLAVGLALGFMLEGSGAYVADNQPDHRPSAYESLAWKELAQRLGREIGGLPDRERLIVRSHYLNGVSFDHVAVLLGLSKGRVSQLHRTALGLLRERLHAAGDFRLER